MIESAGPAADDMLLLAECSIYCVHLCNVVTRPQAVPLLSGNGSWLCPSSAAQVCDPSAVLRLSLSARGSLEVRTALKGGTEAAWFASGQASLMSRHGAGVIFL